jgi:hypothetical protein
MLVRFSTSSLRLFLVAALATYTACGPRICSAQTTLEASLPRWSVPADIDQTMPPVRTDIECPLPELVRGASNRVQELVANLHHFSARERIEHVEIGKKGNLRRAEKTVFNYVAQINLTGSGSPSVEEYRTSEGLDGDENTHGKMIDTGTAAFALILHPFYVGDFDMSCEGAVEVNSRSAWQLRFRQNPNRSNLFHVYRVGNAYYPAKLKGRAWIAADNYEVLRLTTDLLESMEQIRLHREHTDIEYGSVEFKNQTVRLWLPKSAELYMDYRGHRYRRRHKFSDFQLFSVETGEKVKGLKADGKN